MTAFPELPSATGPNELHQSLAPSTLHALDDALLCWGLTRNDLVTELEGGASTRQFFRLNWQGGTAIAMFTPAPSQEIAKARQSGGPAPFIEVAELLERHGVRVPRRLSLPTAHNMLLVEDLGDDTLANFLERTPEHKEALYQTAVRDLAIAQGRLAEMSPTSIIFTRAFDAELLRWEVDHFQDWVLVAQGIQLTEKDRATFAKCADYLATTIACWPRGYVHRDFQSRNLMVRASDDELNLTWIDFQDSMMGPRAYDLVALLTDSYQTFTREFIDQRLLEYCRARGLEHEYEQVCFEFDFLSVQRKLKDAGRFIFIDRVNKNPHFLKYVDSTIARARAALARVKGEGPLSELDELLSRVLP